MADLPQEVKDLLRDLPKNPMAEGRRKGIEFSLANVPAERTEAYLRNVCTTHFRQDFALNLSLEALEGFINKCTPGAISYLMGKLTEFKFDAGKARVQAILDKDPNRK